MTADEPVVAFSVVKGSPTDEEVAALVAVLAFADRRAQPPERETRPAGWSAYWRTVRAPIIPGRDAWRLSARL